MRKHFSVKWPTSHKEKEHEGTYSWPFPERSATHRLTDTNPNK